MRFFEKNVNQKGKIYAPDAVNRIVMWGWLFCTILLTVSYFLFYLSHQISGTYCLHFLLILLIPHAICWFFYLQTHELPILKYFILASLFLFYTYVLFTAGTNYVFSYIFIIYFLMVLYHSRDLALLCALLGTCLNLMQVFARAWQGRSGEIIRTSSIIQIATVVLGGLYCLYLSVCYDCAIQENDSHLKELEESNAELKQTAFESITTIANTIDAKDEYTQGHSRRVAAYSYLLSKELGDSEETAQNIRRCALLHDIGKIGIPDSVLHKPGRLTRDEYRIIQQHPVIGANILKDITLMPDLEIGAKYHHEWYDGTGYPEGRSGDTIPYIARVIAVADTFDAMNSNRIYRSRFPGNHILEELEKMKGRQFDPVIADAMIRLLKSGKLSDTFSLQAEESPTPQTGTGKAIRTGQYLLDELAQEHSSKYLLESLADEDRISDIEQRIDIQLQNEDGCMMLVDVDNIRLVNRKYGNVRGDYALAEIARELISPDLGLMVCRIDGDEFLAYKTGVSSLDQTEQEVSELLLRLQDLLSESEELSGISVSIGAASSVLCGKSCNQLYSAADKALYLVKHQGKNNYYLYRDAQTALPRVENSARDLEHVRQMVMNDIDMHYREFEKVYDLLRNVETADAKTVRIALFYIEYMDGADLTVSNRNVIMRYLESAIVSQTGSVGSTTRFSTTQQLLILSDYSEDEFKSIVDRIVKEFYRMYEKGDIHLCYDMTSAELTRTEDKKAD